MKQISVLFFCFIHFISAQQAQLDSFKKTIEIKNLSDSAIVAQSCTFYIRFSEQNYNLANDALHILLKKDYGSQNQLFYAKIKYALGVTEHIKVDYIKAIINYQESLNYCKKITNLKSKNLILSRLLSNLGLAYLGINDYENGYNYLKQSIEFNKASNDSLALIKNYQLIGYVAELIKNYRDAFKYYELALSYRKYNKTHPEVTLGSLVDWLKISCESKIDKNIIKGGFIADSLKKVQPLNNEALMSYNKVNGIVEKYKKNYSKSLAYYQMAYQNAIIRNYPPEIGSILGSIGEVYGLMNNTKLAIENFENALIIASKSDNNGYLEILDNYGKFSKKIGNTAKAYDLLKRKEVFSDSLYTVQNHNRIIINETIYKTEQKQAQIKSLEVENVAKGETLKNRNYLIWVLLSGLLFLGIFGFSAYKNLNYRKQIAENQINVLKKEKELSATEAVLKGEEQERTRLAKDLHDGLGGMLSGIKHSFASIKGNMIMNADNTKTFQRSLDLVDNSIKEMRRLAHNMMPEALVKFGLNAALIDYCDEINDSGALKINYKGIGIEKDQIDQTKAITVYRIIQELTNNIIKHANAKSVIVQVINIDNKLNITVEDDGQGFDKTLLESAKGIGWSNIYSRVEFLKGTIEVDSEIGKGTSVFIEV